MVDNITTTYLKSLKIATGQKPPSKPPTPPSRPATKPSEVPIRKAAPAPSVPLREAPGKAAPAEHPPQPPPNR